MKNKLIDLDFVEKFMRMSDKQRSDLMIEFFGSVGYEINTVEYGSYEDNEFIPMVKYKVTPSMWLEELENIKKQAQSYEIIDNTIIYNKYYSEYTDYLKLIKKGE